MCHTKFIKDNQTQCNENPKAMYTFCSWHRAQSSETSPRKVLTYRMLANYKVQQQRASDWDLGLHNHKVLIPKKPFQVCPNHNKPRLGVKLEKYIQAEK